MQWQRMITFVTVCIRAFQVDSDGYTLEFEVLISQLFEFLLTLVGNTRFLPLLQPVLAELTYHSIGKPAAFLSG